MKLIIEDDEGRKTVVPFVREEITIGRQEGNTIRLTERNVSRRHARLVRQNGHVLVEDLGSYNGIRINGERISGQTPVHDGDLIQIGDYDLAIQTEAGAQAAAEQAARRAEYTEAATEADAPIVQPEPGSVLDEVDGDEDTSPTVNKQDETGRRQSTSIIKVSQLAEEHESRKASVVELDPEEAPRLFVLNTTYAGREFACIRTELRIGRTDDNDIGLDHRSLSRSHAKLVREESGEWKVVDLQSANGMKVNGEPYAQATLRSGDVVELGHVKLKFLSPGETFRFVPGAYDDVTPSGGGKKKVVPIALGVAVLLIAGIVLGVPSIRASLFGSKPPEKPETVRNNPGPANPDTPAPKPDNGGTEQQATKPPTPPSTPEVKVSDVDEKLKEARSAMDALEFERAVDLLQSIQGADAASAKEAEALLSQANMEITSRKNINEALKELSAGHPDKARELLSQADGTVAYAQEYEKAKAKVDAALAKNAPNAPAKGHANDPDQGLSPTEKAQKYFDEGTALMKKKQYNEAVTAFNKCLENDNTFGRCHMRLGSIYAILRKPDLGAKHYKEFLRLSPDDPKAPDVRRILEQYDHAH